MRSLLPVAVAGILSGCSFTVLAPPPAIDLSPVQVDDSARTSIELVGGVGSAIFGPGGGSGGLRVGHGIDDQLSVQIRGGLLQTDLEPGAVLDGRDLGGDLFVGSVGIGARLATKPRPFRLTAGLAVEREWSSIDLTAMAYTGELGLAYHWKYVSSYLGGRFIHVRPSEKADIAWAEQGLDYRPVDGPAPQTTYRIKRLTPTSWTIGNAGLTCHPLPEWDFWLAAGLILANSGTDEEGGIALGAGTKLDW